jgi:hypothetical protein
MLHYKIKNHEAFKDGNVMEGRFIKAGEILVVSEFDKDRLAQSGGVFDILETLVPNPLRHVAEVHEVVAEIEELKIPHAEIPDDKEVEVLKEKVPSEPKKKASRPKKVA